MIKKSLKEMSSKTHVVLLAILFFLIPLDYVLPHFGSATVVTLASIVIIVYGLYNIIFNNRGEIVFFHGAVSLFVLMLVLLISIIWAINQNVVISRLLSIINTFILYFFVIQFRFDKKSITIIENASLLGACVLVVFVLVNVNLDLVYAGYRLRFSQLGSNYFSDPNGLAGRLIFPLIIAINRILYNKRNIMYLLYAALIIFFSYILLLTGSRAGVIAIIFVAIIFLLQGYEKKRYWILLGFIFLMMLLYFSPRYLPEHISNRLFNLDKYREVSIIEGDRIDIWKHVINDLFISSPILGYGAGCSAYALAEFYGHIKAVHNSYLIILCEVGLLGFIPWMYFVIKQIREALSLRKYSTTILPAIIAILFIAMTLDAFTEKYLWSIFIYEHIVGCCFIEERSFKNWNYKD